MANIKALYETLKAENDELKQLNSKAMLNNVAIKQENVLLKEKSESLAQLNSKTMLASVQNTKEIEEIKNNYKVGSNMYSYEDIKLMYDWGCFTNEQVMVFVPLCITDEEADKIISKEESAS